jgi:chromatin remodeling complex protein RSC6
MAPRKTNKKASDEVSVEVEQVVEAVPTDVVSETVVVDAPVEVSSVEVVTSETSDVDKFVAVLETLQRWATEIKNTTMVVKTLQKEHQKAQKASVKKPKKSTTASGKPRTPSGFAKPTKLSDDLCAFLGVPVGSELARTEVTRVINEYIRKNSLQDTNDKRTIVPDEKLASILMMNDGDKLTYFNLQTYIKHHFHKEVL